MAQRGGREVVALNPPSGAFSSLPVEGPPKSGGGAADVEPPHHHPARHGAQKSSGTLLSERQRASGRARCSSDGGRGGRRRRLGFRVRVGEARCSDGREGAAVTMTRKRRLGEERRQATEAGDVDSDVWTILCHVCENPPHKPSRGVNQTVFIVRGC
jgi:hypothetical protein